MLVVMAIDAQILPVRPIPRIVPVVAILVVHGKEVEIVLFELTPAFGAYPPVQLQGIHPVIFHVGAFRPHFPHKFVCFLR